MNKTAPAYILLVWSVLFLTGHLEAVKGQVETENPNRLALPNIPSTTLTQEVEAVKWLDFRIASFPLLLSSSTSIDIKDPGD